MHLVCPPPPSKKKKGYAILGGVGGGGERHTKCIIEDAQMANSVHENVSMLLLWLLFTVVYNY